MKSADERGVTFLLYAPAEARRVRATRPGEAAPLELGAIARSRTDWSRAGRRASAPIVISRRLVVRPSWVSHALAPGQARW